VISDDTPPPRHTPDAGVVSRPPPAKPAALARSAKDWLGLIPLLAVGAAAGYVGVKFGGQLAASAGGGRGDPLWLSVAPLWFLPLVWLLAVAAHELGHLIGGWAIGGRFLLFAVGPFKWQRTPAGVRFQWNFSFNTFGGLAACLPLQAERATPRRMAWMVAGGPLASLLLAVAALWLVAGLAEPGASSALRTLLHRFTASVAGMSALLAVVTLFPSVVGGFKSDGLRLYGLLRGDRRSEQETALLALNAAMLGGVRPGQLDAALIGRALALRDRSIFDLNAHLAAYAHAADRGEFSRAQACLDYVLAAEAQLMPMIRDSARAEYAWLLAMQTGDAAAARAWFETVGKLDFEPATRLRAEAAVLLAEGRPNEAAALACAGRQALEQRSMSPTRSLFAEEALEEILRRAQRSAARAAVG